MMKRLLPVLIASFAWILPLHAALFYEFNPDYSESIFVATSATVSEVFLPLNDYLGGFDVWVSNASTAGDATFTLYSPSNAVLAERTVVVPAIADTAGGTRLHVNLPAQIAVTGTAAYRIRITTTIPSLRLYYADATRLLAHNGAPVPPYTGGVARIGEDDMGFSFKFALYENSEGTPPQLTGITVAHQSPTQTLISYHANEPIDRRIQYGSMLVDWNEQYSSCAPTVQTCTLTLAVTPGTAYPYTLTVRDVWGNQSVATGTFTTLSQGEQPSSTPVPSASGSPSPTTSPTPTPDTTGPMIINARLVAATPTTATFAWTTNEAANSLVVVHILPYVITTGANNDSTIELEHLVTVANLPSDTSLRATITSSDTAGNTTNATVDFMTLHTSPAPSAASSPTPQITQPPPPSTPIISGPQDNPIISWPTPTTQSEQQNGYRIDIFDNENKLVKTVTVSSQQYQAALGQLPVGNNRIVVYADKNGVFEKVAAPTSVTTKPKQSSLERAIVALPAILGGIVVLIAVGIGVAKLRKPKGVLPTPPPSTPSTITLP